MSRCLNCSNTLRGLIDTKWMTTQKRIRELGFVLTNIDRKKYLRLMLKKQQNDILASPDSQTYAHNTYKSITIIIIMIKKKKKKKKKNPGQDIVVVVAVV